MPAYKSHGISVGHSVNVGYAAKDPWDIAISDLCAPLPCDCPACHEYRHPRADEQGKPSEVPYVRRDLSNLIDAKVEELTDVCKLAHLTANNISFVHEKLDALLRS